MGEMGVSAPPDCPLCHGCGFMFNVPCELYCDYYVHSPKMPAKTTAQRQRELRQNRREKGLKEVRNLWCHPSDIQSIRDYAKSLAEQRNQGKPKQGAA